MYGISSEYQFDMKVNLILQKEAFISVSSNEEGLYVIVLVLLDVLSKLVVNFEDIFLMP